MSDLFRIDPVDYYTFKYGKSSKMERMIAFEQIRTKVFIYNWQYFRIMGMNIEFFESAYDHGNGD